MSWMDDPRAWDEFVAQHRRRLYNLVFGRLHDAEEAEDVTQDAFLAAYEKRETFRGEAKPFSWVCTIAMNLCHKRLAAWHRQSQWVVPGGVG